MIQPPRRSVTRFFIPLIDVLTLLFCIFLVMPLARDAREANKTAEEKAAEGRTKQLEAELKRLRDENARLRGARAGGKFERATVRILEVNDKTGELYYYKGQTRADLDDRAAVRRVVDEDRLLVSDPRKLTYVLRLPRNPGYAHPNREDLANYEAMFRGLAVFGVDGDLTKEKEGGP